MLIMVQGGEDLHYYFVKVAEKPSMEVWGRRTNTTILADVFWRQSNLEGTLRNP